MDLNTIIEVVRPANADAVNEWHQSGLRAPAEGPLVVQNQRHDLN
jgi:hypothetical protein